MYIALCCWCFRLNIFAVKKLLRRKMNSKSIATVYAILAAALYAINVPLSKVLLNYVEPTMMASFFVSWCWNWVIFVWNCRKIDWEGWKKSASYKKRVALHNRNGDFRHCCTNFVDAWNCQNQFCKCFIVK